MRPPDFVHGRVPDFFAQGCGADHIGEHNRQHDPLAADPFLEATGTRLTFGRHDERIEVPLPVGGLVHRLDFRPEVNPLLRLGQ